MDTWVIVLISAIGLALLYFIMRRPAPLQTKPSNQFSWLSGSIPLVNSMVHAFSGSAGTNADLASASAPGSTANLFPGFDDSTFGVD